MDKKLINIENHIQNSSEDFYNYLNRLLPSNVVDVLNQLMSYTNVYLFSGIIRDYFINQKNDFRDIDFVIERNLDNIETIFGNYDITKNSFGGYKIHMDSIKVDIWSIENTWAIKKYPRLPLVNIEINDLLKTTFFNASSIMYFINKKQFIIGKPFLGFLKNKKLDIVLEDNPEPALCIVNSFYYAQKYHLNFSKNLMKYIAMNYIVHSKNFESIQEKHFDQIIYSKQKLLQNIKKYLNANKVLKEPVSDELKNSGQREELTVFENVNTHSFSK